MTIGVDAVSAPSRLGSVLPRVSEAQFGMALLWFVLGAGAAWRLWFAAVDDSIYWPDEIYQTLEPAHRLLHGYGILAWEYRDGARSWFLPGVLAAVLWSFERLGLERPAEYLPAFKLLFSTVGVFTAWGCWSLARSLGATRSAAAAAAAAFALAAPLIYFAPRALGETISAAPVVWAFAIALRPGAGRRALAWAAALLTVAVFIRLQNGLFCLGLLAALAGQKRWSDARFALTALSAGALCFGALDWVTWGRPFHSALVYVQFNLIDGRASEFGTAPWTYYAKTFSTSMPVLAGLTAAFFIAGYRRAPVLSWTALIALLSLWLIPHKEFRFVVPALPLFCAVAALGVDRVGEAVRRWGGAGALTAGVAAAGLASAAQTPALTFGDLGQITDTREVSTPSLDHHGAVNRLLIAASERPDLCGVAIVGAELAWAGGYTHLHRDVPLTDDLNADPRLDHVIARREQVPALGGRVLALDGGWALIRLPRRGC